jgi:hypothetical protein
MAFEHRALEVEELGPAVWKVCKPDAPAPLRGMVARGLAPLGPRDLVVALYQLWVTNDPELAEVAAKSVSGLPPNILSGALDDKQLPAGALDFLGRKLPQNVEVLERVVQHPAVDDQTLAGLARICPERIADILAENQERWLRCPAIVENLYQNPHCRMSVVQRMLELAVRQGVELALPNIEEIKIALGEEQADPDPERDELFRSATGDDVAQAHARMVERVQQAEANEEIKLEVRADDPGEDIDIEEVLAQTGADDLSLPLDAAEVATDASSQDAIAEAVAAGRGGRLGLISKLRPMEKIRLSMLGSAFERSVLIRDANKQVCMSAIKSPRVKENEVVAYSANRTLSHEVVRYIARRRDWAKLYAVKLNLVLNPKTPMSQAMGFLGHLHAHDVRKVAHSRNIPSALAQAAKRKMQQRG